MKRIRHISPPHPQAGFTLLEMTIVLAIIAIVTSMALTSGLAVVANARQSATVQRLAAIDQALLAYRKAYDRLPCPSNLSYTASSPYYGLEGIGVNTQWLCIGVTDPSANNASQNIAGTAVAVAEGAVPAITLGLPAEFMFDGWGNHIRYAVDASMTQTGMFTDVPAGAACGAITVNDANGNARSSSAIYALISHGANSNGAYNRTGVMGNNGNTLNNNANEQMNCHCDSSGFTGDVPAYAATYVQAPYYVSPTDATNVFDDIVTYKERWQMQVPWDKPGTVCPAIYVGDAGNSRIQKFDLNGNYLGQFGSSGTGNGQFTSLRGVKSDASGNIWVADFGNNRVQELSSSGVWQMTIGGGTSCTSCNSTSACTCSSGSGNGLFSGPRSLAFDTSGNIWVAEQNNPRVQRFSSLGAWIQTIGGGANCVTCTSTSTCPCYALAGTNGMFGLPRSVTVDKYGNLWVPDGPGNLVQKFDKNGNFLFQFGASGSGNSQFNNPTDIAVDAAGNIWVVDSGNNRLQQFDQNGNYLTQFGSTGGGTGQFTNPFSLAFDTVGNIWVVDSGNNRIQKFDPNGNYLSQFGSGGSGNGLLTTPYYLYISR